MKKPPNFSSGGLKPSMDMMGNDDLHQVRVTALSKSEMSNDKMLKYEILNDKMANDKN
jgi:hypothetical protein